MWGVEVTDEFGRWWKTLTADEQESLAAGGDKTGDARFYDRRVPLADRLYHEHLKALKKEGLLP